MRTIEAVNLFGETITLKISEAKRTPTQRKGYAAQPGTGPDGETCKTCAHARKCNEGGAKQFYKCVLMERHWTGGYGTDILIKSPACMRWEAK